MEKKMTNAQMFELIKETCADNEEIVAFCDKQLESLANKAVKAAERAAAKKAEGDELRAVIASMLTNEPQTGEDIAAAIEVAEGEEPITKQKVVTRMSQLVALGQAAKTEITVEVDGKAKKKVAYTLPVEG